MTDKYLEELTKDNKMTNYNSFMSASVHIDNTPSSKSYIYDFLNKFVSKYNLTKIDLDDIIERIIKGLHGEIKLNDFYNYVADQCVVKTSSHPEYNKLASKILAERLHKMTESDILKITDILYNNMDSRGNRFPLLDNRYVEFVKANADKINSKLDFNRDFDFDYFGLRTLERSYLMRLRSYKKTEKKIVKEDILIERPQHLFMRVALFIHLNNLELAFETYDLLSQKYFTHATPTLFNAGSPRPQMSSCYLIACEDSMNSITDTLSDVMQISKWAGGIGVHISSIRGDGSIIRGTNGLSDGIVGLCKGFNWASLYVNQGGKRNGSVAVYMEPWHSDIFQFCELRMNTGSEDKRCRDLFLALWIPDLFMQRVENDEMWSLMCPDQCPNLNKVHSEEFNKLYLQYEAEGKFTSRVSARKLFKHILTCQSETGFPYMLYKDHANRKSNQKNLGTIRSSNLCVSGDTYILTKQGQFPIKNYVNKNVNVWNGTEWSQVVVKKTGVNQELVRVSLSNGTHIDCTPEHKFYIQEAYWRTESKELPAKDLKTGNKLIKWNLPTDVECIETEFKYPYTHGFFCGDGTTVDNYSKTLKYPVLTLYGEKKLLIEHIDKTSYSDNNANNVIHVTLPKDLEQKFKVPINNNKNTQLRWLEGFFDADGSVCRNGTNESLQACSIEKDFLIQIRLMLQTLGIESKVTLARKARQELLPDGKGGKKLYECKPLWRILISSTGLYKLANMGFVPKRLKFVKREPQRDCEQFVEVLNVTNLPTKQDTYCFTEPLKHMGMFNGILTGQCAEIVEYSDENETAVCNLVSLCLPKYIEYRDGQAVYNFNKLMDVTRVAVRNLNNVIDLNFYPTEKTKVSNFKNRPVGIGIQGMHDIYNMMGFGFDSNEAELLNRKIFETIYYAAVDESKNLAKIHGPYDSFKGSPFSEGKLQYHLWGLKDEDLLMGFDWAGLTAEVKKYGTRNSLLTALMPTASTAQIMGNYEGFEPYLTNIFVRTTLAGEFIVINENLIRDLEKLNLWSEDMRKLIIIYNGSIQHIDSIPQKIKDIYKTAFELSLKSIIKQSVERGPFIDQSQSMNLFQAKPNFKVLYTAHMYGWKNGLKTGMYYLRTSPAVNPINFGIDIDDLKRLTGLDSIEELISHSIDDSNNSNVNSNVNPNVSPNVKRKRNTNSNSNEKEENEQKDEEKSMVCRYVRGQAPVDCLVCSS
jgi:ribonucleoside-diphosphate reductase alpha chain